MPPSFASAVEGRVKERAEATISPAKPALRTFNAIKIRLLLCDPRKITRAKKRGLLRARAPSARRLAAAAQLLGPVGYFASWAAMNASISFFLSAWVSTGGSREMVSLSILPVKAKGTR